MASVRACDDVLLLSCGEKVAVYDFRFCGEGTIIDIPQNKEGRKGDDDDDDDGDDDKKNDKQRSHNKQPPPANRVLAADVSRDGQYVAVCDDRKFLHVFHNQQQRPLVGGDQGQGRRLTLISSRCVSRRCTVVRFTADLKSVLVADKSGDVFSFPLHPPPTTSSSSPSTTAASQATESRGDVKMKSHDKGRSDNGDDDNKDTNGGSGDKDTNGGGDGGGFVGELVLGHLSMLLDMIMVEDGRYVVTADRDEKIRLSNYPDAYNIHTYCLGHTAFVISLACDDSNKILFSGSGDASVCAWTYDGNLLDQRRCVQDFPQLVDADTAQEMSEEPFNEKTPPTTSTTTTASTTTTTSSSNSTTPEESRQAVQQITYCSDCSLLFVALYKCPHILVYRMASSTNAQPSLQPVRLLTSGQAGHVVSLCIQNKCVLWVVRKAEGTKLQLEAVRICVQEDNVVSTSIDAESDSPESRILKSASSHPDLLTEPQPCQDPIPSLWKSQIDGYVHDYMERKRQRLEGSAPTQDTNTKDQKKFRGQTSKTTASGQANSR